MQHLFLQMELVGAVANKGDYMILNLIQLDSLLENVKKDILEKYGSEVKQIILFGSYAKKKATKKSDIDILVLFKNNTSTTSDLIFADNLYDKYINKTKKELHILFEKYDFYIDGAEEFYRNVPKYGRIIYKV